MLCLLRPVSFQLSSAYYDNVLWQYDMLVWNISHPIECQFIWYEIWGLKDELLDAFEFYHRSVFYYTFVYNLTGSFCSVSFAWKGISLVSHFSSHFLSNSIFWALCWFHASHWKGPAGLDVMDKFFSLVRLLPMYTAQYIGRTKEGAQSAWVFLNHIWPLIW